MPAPSDLWELPFLRDALVEVVLLAVAGGMVGAWVVLRRLAFFSHAVGSATFPAWSRPMPPGSARRSWPSRWRSGTPEA